MRKIQHTALALFTLSMTVLPIHAAVECADSSATGHYVHQLMIDYKPGAILHTNDFLRGNNPEVRTMNHNMGYHLKYAFSAPENSRESNIYRDAYQGVGVGYNDFNPQLSNPISLYLFQGARIASLGRRLGLNYEWNFGLAMGWNPYDEESNPDNRVIGSRVTAYMDVDLYLRWILSRHVDLNFGIGVAHYSNGNTQFPNLGLNTAALRVGASYYINRHTATLQHRHEPMPPADRHLTYDLILFGAWRQRGTYEDGVAYTLPGKVGVFGVNLNPMYTMNHWLRLGASLDYTYDRTANLYYDVDYIDPDEQYRSPSATKQMALGMSARVEFTMPYFAINFGIGTNFINGGGDFKGVYEILALKVNLTRRMLLHIGYSLNDFHTPKHLMLGVGWRFGRVK